MLRRWSAKVGRPCRPISFQIESGSGSVAIIIECSGMIARLSPGSLQVYSSVQRSTFSARMRPRSVVSRPFAIVRTGDCSKILTPRASRNDARPQASFAGWRAAQCGE